MCICVVYVTHFLRVCHCFWLLGLCACSVINITLITYMTYLHNCAWSERDEMTVNKTDAMWQQTAEFLMVHMFAVTFLGWTVIVVVIAEKRYMILGLELQNILGYGSLRLLSQPVAIWVVRDTLLSSPVHNSLLWHNYILAMPVNLICSLYCPLFWHHLLLLWKSFDHFPISLFLPSQPLISLQCSASHLFFFSHLPFCLYLPFLYSL